MLAKQAWLGAELYTDFDDPNLPSSFWVVMPAVWMEIYLGLQIDQALVTWMCIVTFCVTFGIGQIMRQSGTSFAEVLGTVLILSTFSVYGVAYDIGQREHFVALLLVLVIVVQVSEARSGTASRVLLIVAGVAGALALSIKPFYGLCLIGAELACWTNGALHKRPSRTLLSVAAFSVILAALQLALYPQILTFLSDRKMYFSFTRMPGFLDVFLFYLGLCALMIIGRPSLLRGREAIASNAFLFAALGGIAAYLVQWKGWMYHGLPFYVFALLFLTAIMARVRQQGPISFLALSFILALTFVGYAYVQKAAFVDRSKGAGELFAGVSGPVVMLTDGIDMAFPAAAFHKGGWGIRYPSLYLIQGLQTQPENPETSELESRFRKNIAEDLHKSQPELIIARTDSVVGGDLSVGMLEWLMQDPAFAEIMEGYVESGKMEHGTIFYRRDRRP